MLLKLKQVWRFQMEIVVGILIKSHAQAGHSFFEIIPEHFENKLRISMRFSRVQYTCKME